MSGGFIETDFNMQGFFILFKIMPRTSHLMFWLFKIVLKYFYRECLEIFFIQIFKNLFGPTIRLFSSLYFMDICEIFKFGTKSHRILNF